MEIFKILGTVAIDGMEAAASGIGNLGSVAVKAGKAIAAGLAAGATAIGALAKQSLDSYAEYEQLIGGVETLYGAKFKTLEEYIEGTGASVKYAEESFKAYQNREQKILENASNAYRTAGISANEYMETVNGFAASLTSSLGEYEWQAANYADMIVTNMADNANKMGTSMESIQNAYSGFAKQNYTMLDNLKLGYGGTKEEMERLLRDAEKFDGALEGSFDINSFADVAYAINVIQEQMGISGVSAEYAAEMVAKGLWTQEEAFERMGTTAREGATTIQGSLAMTKAAWQNLMTGFADGEADVKLLIDNLVGSATTAMENIVPRIAQIFSGISSALEQVMPIIVAELPGILEQLLPGLISGAVSLFNGLVTALPVVLRILLEQLPFIMSQISAGLIQIFPVLLQTVKDLFGQIWEYLVNELFGIGISFEDTFALVTDIFYTVWDALTMIWDNVGKPLFNIIKVVVERIFKNFKTLWDETLKPVFSGIIEFLDGVFKGDWEKIWNGIESILKGVLNGIISGIEWMINKAIDGLNALIDALNELAVVDAIAKIFGADGIPRLKNITLPRLEEGGILEKGQVGLLEGKGAEAVVPLDQNQAWISAVARDMESAIGGGATQVLEQILNVLQTMDDNMTEKMQDAFASMKFDVNNREFARMVKVV